MSGDVSLGIIDCLPFDGIHLILGNDLAGDKVTVNPILSDKPCITQSPDVVEQVIPDLYPQCAVTRAMEKQQQLEDANADESDLSDTFLANLFHSLDSPTKTDTAKSSDNSNADNSPNFSQSNLITEQQNDPEISSLFQKASDETDAANNPVCYFIKNGILLRKWRPPLVSGDDEWSVRYQIVVPKTYRSEILSLAHETPVSGHLGINKTHQKILSHFYWPGVRKDVAQFCKTCHT